MEYTKKFIDFLGTIAGVLLTCIITVVFVVCALLMFLLFLPVIMLATIFGLIVDALSK